MQANMTATLIEQDAITGYDAGNRPIYGTKKTPVDGGIIVWSQSSSENVDGEDLTTDVLVALFPAGVNVPSTAQVELPIGTYQIQGVAFAWKSPLTGTTPGTTATLMEVK